MCQNQKEALTYRWDPKVVIYPYELGPCWGRLMVIGILNKGTIEIVCPIVLSKGHLIMKYMTIVIPLVEFDICTLELEYVIWSHNKWGLYLKD